jgi:threonine dehydrogenase-like Zn-dependent dehydrogenase
MKTRSLVFKGPGCVEIEDQDIAQLGPRDLLIKTQVNGICAFELHAFTGELKIDWFPLVMGHEAVGIVADTGKEVSNFKTGDKVSTLGFSNYRDFYTIEQSQAAKIPQDETNFHHWLGEPPACAVNAIRLMEQHNAGNRATILGCGFMGLLLVQLGVKRGMDIIAYDLNPERLELARQFGARIETPQPNSQDIVIECSGSEKGIASAEGLTRNGGLLCLFAHHLPNRLCNTNLWHMKGLDVLNATPAASRDWTRDFQEAIQYIHEGTFNLKPLITHFFPADNPQRALEYITKNRPKDYIKGVFTFDQQAKINHNSEAA